VKFWPVTWGQLAPGDLIQAPNGSVWKVGAAIICDGRGEWEISNPELGHMWTEQREDTPVQATRPYQPPTPLATIKAAEALLGDLLGAERVES
jgi:hypothetical protein